MGTQVKVNLGSLVATIALRIPALVEAFLKEPQMTEMLYSDMIRYFDVNDKNYGISNLEMINLKTYKRAKVNDKAYASYLTYYHA